MKKIQKLERRKKITKYIIITIIIVLGLLSIGEVCFGISEYIRSNIEIGQLAWSLLALAEIPLLAMMWYSYKNLETVTNLAIKNEEAKAMVKTEFNLSMDEFVEVFWNDETDDDDNSIRKDQEENDAKFYARLISDDEMEVIAKTKDGELIGATEKIVNFCYFKEHYKSSK